MSSESQKDLTSSPEPQARRQKLYAAVPWVLVIGLSVSNGLLLIQNSKMRAVLSNQKPNIVRTGDRMAPFEAQGPRGELFRVNYTGHGPEWVLLFFSPA